jgi:hypothetical protein
MQTPTMVQYFTSPKSSRGSRLGRGADSTSTMEQYGYSAPGTNVTVSPTFSDIGNPTTYTEGLSIGDVSLSNLSEAGSGGFTTNNESGPGGIQTTPVRPLPGGGGGGGGGGRNGGGGGGGGRNGGGGGGGGRNGGGGETRGITLARALKGAVRAGEPGDPRATRSEIKSIMQETGQGPRGLRNAINEGNINLGKGATNFLNNKLQELGAKPLSKDRTIETPPPNKVGATQKQQEPVKPFLSGQNPFFPFQQMQAGANKTQTAKTETKKADAKSKAQAAKKKK